MNEEVAALKGSVELFFRSLSVVQRLSRVVKICLFEFCVLRRKEEGIDFVHTFFFIRVSSDM